MSLLLMYFQLCISWNLCKILHHLITFFASSECVFSQSLFLDPSKHVTSIKPTVFTGGYKQRAKYTKCFFFLRNNNCSHARAQDEK